MADEKTCWASWWRCCRRSLRASYGRVDMHIDEAVKQSAIARAKAGVAEFAGMKVLVMETLDAQILS